jgi:hypothetical protein
MATKQHTQHSVGAAVRKAAKQAGVGIEVKVSRKSTEVRVSAMYRWDCERNQSRELGERVSDWLRANVPADALATGFVKVEVDNSEAMVDYFSYTSAVVWPTLELFIKHGAINTTWAKVILDYKYNGLGSGTNGMTYDRGSYNWTRTELDSLGATDEQETALAMYAVADTRDSMPRDEFVARFEALGHLAHELFFSMYPTWSESLDDLLVAVEALAGTSYGQEPVEEIEEAPEFDLLAFRQDNPATVEDLPQSVREYLDRLIHEPKKKYALAVALAYASYQEPPKESAAWADSVVVKVKRYMGR